ncbi:hypothetical protein HGO97_009855 [Faecalicatena sp. AGMB00832]|uniref:Type IV pilus assembly protein PilM n=1 Tax=Faecalicatena faecalis TaxID=2726362 RepID=A0ABS6D463_9FIRM|nr:hypothetical protein [Faecalicatena faecalis]MBU3876115.1 hypothetical protein [Faecalicatena faecalis]
MVVVYLSNRYIRVVEGDASGGKIHAKALYYTIDTRGCILNGTITDVDGFREMIKNLWETNNLPRKGVSLVIDSSQFTTKVVDAPPMKPKQMMEYISREFTDVERISNPVYGYFPLSGSGGKKEKVKRIFSVVAPREFVREYQDIFSGLGITISSIESVVGVALRLAEILPQLEDSTCIVQFADDMALMNLLLVDGRYQYSNRNRMFSEKGTPEFAAEAARTVSNLIQFAKAQELAMEIPKVYIAGLSEDEFQVYRDSISQINDQMEAEELNLGQTIHIEKEAGGQSVTNFALAIGGLLKTDAKTSMMAQVEKDPLKEQERKQRKKVLIPLGILTGVLLGLTAAMGIRVLLYSRQLQELNDYNQREDIVAACDEYDALNAELSSSAALGKSMESLKVSLLGYPRIDSKTEQVVAACASGLVSAQISSYNAESGMMSFNAEAGNVEQINQFIKLLNQQEIFSDVDYTGYSQGSDNKWSVNVNCIMAGRQGQSDDTEANTEG